MSFSSCYLVLSFTVFFLMLQFIREYTGKVDELVKDKIEAQNQVKAKEQEEKEVIAQQVISFAILFPALVNIFYLL